jgi:drug/metabolite transporter (DMT)-like permease
MTPVFFGAMSALGFGTADFMARFSSRAMDHHNALLGMLLAGFLPLSLWVLLAFGLPPLDGSDLGWVFLTGAATTVMTLLLYWGLARGPISVVAPIVGAHPVLVILYYVGVHGLEPTTAQWIAMLGTICGIVLVAGASNKANASTVALEYPLAPTVLIALAASLALAVVVIAGQAAAQIHGEFHTLWLGRIVSIAVLLALFGIRRRKPTVPKRWWPFLCVQGLLDAGAYIALFAGSTGDGKAIVAVVAATFGAVTIALARVILKEPIGAVQWLGIVLVFAGVMILSG